MARCRLSLKNAKKYAVKAGVDPEAIHAAMTRGGTNHRIDFWMKDGSIMCYCENYNDVWKSESKWSLSGLSNV